MLPKKDIAGSHAVILLLLIIYHLTVVIASLTSPKPSSCSHGDIVTLDVVGKVGALTLALSDLLWEDMIAGPETHRLRIPYM